MLKQILFQSSGLGVRTSGFWYDLLFMVTAVVSLISLGLSFLICQVRGLDSNSEGLLIISKMFPNLKIYNSLTF